MSILQICSHERLNVSGKQIQSLSLLGHWLKSCLFQQWPKLITIQACCSVTNSMWKELVASEAGAHCQQPQQKDQGFGWTLNKNFSSTPGIISCPNPISGMDGICWTTHRGDLCWHMSSALQPGGWDSVLPPSSLPTLLRSPLISSLLLPHKAFAGPTWAKMCQCWCQHIHQYPRMSFMQDVPWLGDWKLTSGEQEALRAGSASVCQKILRIKEMTSYIFDTRRESVLHK